MMNQIVTLTKTNIQVAPKNGGFPVGISFFQGVFNFSGAFAVSSREGT